MRADFCLFDLYPVVASVSLDCRVVAWSASDDPRATPALMRGWEEVGRGGFVLRMLEGGHMFVYDGPLKAAWLRQVVDLV
jgi:surfactin synthase thioesterase subunit